LLRRPKRRTDLGHRNFAAVGSRTESRALPACRNDPQEALILDIFDLIDRYYNREGRPARVDRLGAQETRRVPAGEVRMEVQTAEMKKFLKAHENGEELSPTPLEETSPTPIPTPYDDVKIDVTAHVGFDRRPRPDLRARIALR
jgi:hypothetical protein